MTYEDMMRDAEVEAIGHTWIVRWTGPANDPELLHVWPVADEQTNGRYPCGPDMVDLLADSTRDWSGANLHMSLYDEIRDQLVDDLAEEAEEHRGETVTAELEF